MYEIGITSNEHAIQHNTFYKDRTTEMPLRNSSIYYNRLYLYSS